MLSKIILIFINIRIIVKANDFEATIYSWILSEDYFNFNTSWLLTPVYSRKCTENYTSFDTKLNFSEFPPFPELDWLAFKHSTLSFNETEIWNELDSMNCSYPEFGKKLPKGSTMFFYFLIK